MSHPLRGAPHLHLAVLQITPAYSLVPPLNVVFGHEGISVQQKYSVNQSGLAQFS